MSEYRTADWLGFVGRLEGEGLQAKNIFLARVAYELTVRARDTYEPGTVGVSDPAKLRAVNEVMHRLTHRALKLSRGSDDDRSEREFWQGLAEIAERGGCLDDLISAASAASSISGR